MVKEGRKMVKEGRTEEMMKEGRKNGEGKKDGREDGE
jgi:hypothetical protein